MQITHTKLDSLVFNIISCLSPIMLYNIANIEELSKHSRELTTRPLLDIPVPPPSLPLIPFRELTIFTRPLPERPVPPPPVDLVQQLQEELGRKNMLYLKHHLQLTRVVGEGNLSTPFAFYVIIEEDENPLKRVNGLSSE